MSNNTWTKNFMIVGVGGQGTLLAAEIIATVGVRMGCDVKKSEIHGMAQRGGSVSSQVRWGESIFSPIFMPGEADYLLAFELLEAVRYAHWLRNQGLAILNDYRIIPISVTTGQETYPEDTIFQQSFAHAKPILVPAMQIANQIGQNRVNNVVMLGALSSVMPIEESIWQQALEECIPERYLAVNRTAFTAGRSFMLERETSAN